MKTIRIYKREVMERTQFRKYRFKQVTQTVVVYNGREYDSHRVGLDNKNLRIKFRLVLETRSKKELDKYVASLGRSDADKNLKATIEKIMSAEQK